MANKEKQISYFEAWKHNLRAWKIFWSIRPGIFISGLLNSIFTAVTPYVTIWLSAKIINELARNRDPKSLLNLVLIQLASASVLALISGILNHWSNYELYLMRTVDSRIYMDKMLEMDYSDIDKQYVYGLYSQIRQTENFSGYGSAKTITIFGDLVTSAIQIICGVGLSASLFLANVPESAGEKFALLNSPICAVAILAIMLVVDVLSTACANHGDSYWARYTSEGKLGNRFFSFYGFACLSRKRAVDFRMYSQQENVCNVYFSNHNIFGPNSKIAKWAKGPMGLLLALSEIISVILTGIIYLFVCLKSWAGAFGVGSVTQYIGAITNLFLGISKFFGTLGTMRTNSSFLNTNFELLDIPNSMYKGSLTTEKRSDRQYEVEFKDVSFKYPDSETYALRHANVKFRVGSRLAVVGMNGSGKTTFIKLLCRLYDPTEGQILLNGIDIRKYKYDDYIRIFSVVFQDFQLFAMPLGENVAGAATFDRERVMKCLKNAGFEDRVKTMPHGLDTNLYKDLDNEGVDVSGGEAQKIAIARALYKDAPFIILDEPTAALDPIAEAEIYSKFNDIVGNKTAIYISHRLSSCKFCDEIIVFHDGAIIQHGAHEELISDKNGKYYELWNAQSQYYAKEQV